jgi:putative ABC transport system ATP-binding protein
VTNGDGVSNDAVVRAVGLSRDYPSGREVVHALSDVNLAVCQSEIVAVRGRSGSGKTTLLNLLGGLDRPTSGSVTIDGHEVTAMSDEELESVRRGTVSFIFQGFGLIPFLTAAENVEIPLRLIRADPAMRDKRVAQLLEKVGLAARMRHRPHELSGGERQRVAIARALATRPRVLLADEPTGQLDTETGRVIMRLLRSIIASEGITAVIATHDPLMLEVADRVVELRDGRILQTAEPAPA